MLIKRHNTLISLYGVESKNDIYDAVGHKDITASIISCAKQIRANLSLIK